MKLCSLAPVSLILVSVLAAALPIPTCPPEQNCTLQNGCGGQPCKVREIYVPSLTETLRNGSSVIWMR